MIKSFRSKVLAKVFLDGDSRDVPATLRKRVEQRLAVLDAATELRQLQTPSLRLHPWEPRSSGIWSIDVNGPWRIIFRWDNGDAYEVDLVQPH